jgi:hypothetical protein
LELRNPTHRKAGGWKHLGLCRTCEFRKEEIMESTTTFCLAVQAPAMNGSAIWVATLGSDAALELVFVVFGLVLLGFWYRGQKRAKRAMTWPQVPGKIIESTIVGAKNFDGGDEKARVLYSYVVNGISLHSKSVGAGVLSSPAGIVKRYPVGKQVQVYYDPENPKSAFLERSRSGPIIILLLSIVNLAFGFGTLVVGLIHNR